METPPLPLGIYRHYKGHECEVIGIAHHSETLEQLVVYRELGDSKGFGPNPLWVRPLAMFTENVESGGKTVPRFMRIEA